MGGERLGDVGQGAVGIGLPEPAAAARLEIGDEAPRLLRLPFQRQALAGGEEELARARDRLSQDRNRLKPAPIGTSGSSLGSSAATAERGRGGEDHQQPGR